MLALRPWQPSYGQFPATVCFAGPGLTFPASSVKGAASLRGLVPIQANAPFGLAIGWIATLWLNGEAKQAVTEDLVVQS